MTIREQTLDTHTAELARSVAEQHGISMKDLLSSRRGPRTVWIARRALYVALWRGGESTVGIGRILHKDHTTIMHGLRLVLGNERYDKEVAERGGRQARGTKAKAKRKSPRALDG